MRHDHRSRPALTAPARILPTGRDRVIEAGRWYADTQSKVERLVRTSDATPAEIQCAWEDERAALHRFVDVVWECVPGEGVPDAYPPRVARATGSTPDTPHSPS